MKKPPFITPTCGHPSHREPLRIGEINYTAQQINELLSLIPYKADKKEVFPNDSYLGHFPMGAQLPDMDRFAWAFVGDLDKAHPYFYYPKSNVPQGYQTGWNDMAKEFGTYLLTPGKQDQLTAEELFKEKFRLPELTADRAIADEHGNRITDTYVRREAVANHIKQIYNQQFLDNPPLITEGYITPEMLSEETKQMLEATGQEITNLPDGEDLQSVHGVLKLADKQYNPNSYSGLGRRILRKNIVAGVNVLTQSMMQWPNTIYVIQYDYDLQGAEFTIPEGCVLDFQGGSLKNGGIVSANIRFQGNINAIFNNIELRGSTTSVISPFMFGFNDEAEDNYPSIYAAHTAAKNMGTTISYDGVKRVNIIVEDDFISIPLTGRDDFKNAEFHIICNASKHFYLFTLSGKEDIIDNTIGISNVLSRSFPLDNNKQYTLFVKDLELWTHRYGKESIEDRYREDVICIRNNKGINFPCTKYNENSQIECSLIENKPYQRYLRNLSITRESSIGLVRFIFIEYCSNMTIENINLKTIKDDNTPKAGDTAFNIQHCAFFYFKNIAIDNVYSVAGSGHGYELDAVYHFVYDNITGYDNNWGIFGANNVNDVAIYNSNINRFDIHCYGRDIKFYNCTFTGNKYNQFSSMYGIVSFEDCIFDYQFLPYLQEGSYNAYTYHELIFRNCQFYTNRCLYLYSFNKTSNTRAELSVKYLPSIKFENVLYYNNGNTYNLIDVDSPIEVDGDFEGVGGLYNISINNMKFMGTAHDNFNLASKRITLLNECNIVFDRCNVTNMRSYKEIQLSTYASKLNISSIVSTDITNNVVFNNCFLGLYTHESEAFNHIYNNCIVYNYRYSNNPNSIYKQFNNCVIVLSNKDDGNTVYMIKDSFYNNCKFVALDNSYLSFYMNGRYVFKQCAKEVLPNRTGGLLTQTQIWKNEGITYKDYILENELTDLMVIKSEEKGVVFYNNYPFSTEDVNYPFSYISTNSNLLPFIHGKNKKNYNIDGTDISKVIIVSSHQDFTSENCTYKINSDIPVGDNFIMPANCTLDFNGGRLVNGKVQLSNTRVIPNGCIITDYIPTGITGTFAPGQCVFDPVLGKPKWYNGTKWVDATGAEV